MFIILLAPLFSALWLWLGSRNPSIPAKMGFGLIFLGVGFAVLAWGSANATLENPVSPSWLVVTYFLHTVGELCLSPIGLSSITKLSPARYVGQMMGIWFMGAALGNLVAGRVAGLIEIAAASATLRRGDDVLGGCGVSAAPLYETAEGLDRRCEIDLRSRGLVIRD